MPLALPAFAADITVGTHQQLHVGPLTFNLDTIWATAIAMVIVIWVALKVRREASSDSPGRLQVAWEVINDAVTRQVEGSIGPAGRSIIPLAVTLFVFILTCNLFELLGLGSTLEFFAVPTGDINLPLAMALYVIVLVHTYSIRARGVRGYFRHYLTHPFPIYLFPVNLFINLIEEIAKPITLALRLFGNLLSGALMLSLIAALGAWKLGAIPVGNVLVLFLNPAWK